LPFNKLNPLNKVEGLSLPAGRQGLTLSGTSTPTFKAGFGAAEWVKMF
jgi:hypothetical protein